MATTTFGRIVEIILASHDIQGNSMIQAKWAAAEIIDAFEMDRSAETPPIPTQTASVRDEV